MKLRWTRLALADFLSAQKHIAQDNPLAAQAVAQRIDEAARGLLDHPPSAGRARSRARASAWSAGPRI